MPENYVQVTILMKDMDSIEVSCEADSPLLQQICHGLASKGLNPDEIMFLQLSGDEDEFLYFPKSALQGIRSDQPLPEELFQNPNAITAEDFSHLDIDSEWANWAVANMEKGKDRKELNRIMLDQGMHQEDISELLGFIPDQPMEITDLEDRQSIEPRLGAIIPIKNRVDSEYIELYLFENFLDDAQCKSFETLITDDGSRSTVIGETPIHDARTSNSFSFKYGKKTAPLVTETQNRLCALVGADSVYAEPLQCQIYTAEQRYKAHNDYFSNDSMPSYSGIDGKQRNGQRQWSAVVYLRDCEPGSGTYFPKLRKEFAPKQGSAIVWNNLYPDGMPNKYTLHAGLPARQEKKLVLTQWIRRSQDNQ